MAKFKVVKPYKDLELDKKLKKNDEVEMTVKRADEVEKTLKANGFDGPFLKRSDKK
ncbi:hypothetical protein [Staphylococcus saprophyticus]|uniref:hypothetical protein n=1 Tax=Staphylococcus saprophyticus TaxID=29385 RepID=UPI0019D190B7|nr:hypothetical protein [Staphylococcus saprophyticus]MBN6755871.1 hypothetical protein [Staphylococcus saprophyticus]MBN6765849.1 hypothetical protein [Staphylococcus saprophyticus]MBN6771250.1 hypothetical protein [Staphylococcus saprophyticus]MBN6780184.1 hypothetical protein [Staphylococcus saprophyticus]MBN6787614.1 hypothetical protein [Staphylococcus saprophyticus]